MVSKENHKVDILGVTKALIMKSIDVVGISQMTKKTAIKLTARQQNVSPLGLTRNSNVLHI